MSSFPVRMTAPRGLLLLLLALSALPAAGAEQALVGGDPNYPPFHYLNEQGLAAGRDIELIRAIAADQGFTVEFSLLEWGRVLGQLERGSVDVVPMFITEDRRARFDFSQPFARRHHQVFGPRGSARVEGIEDLAGRRVAVQFAGMAYEWLANQDAGIDIRPINIEDSAVLAVERGEADYALVPADIGERAIAVHGLEDIVALSPPLLERDYAFGVSRGRPALREKIDAGLARLRDSGELARIMAGEVAGRVPVERQQRPIDAGQRASVSWWIAGLILLGLLFWVGARWARTPEG
jgi:ABC-type amino acid transport substrate-binding protein